MKVELQARESRSHVILNYTRQALLDRRLVIATFAANVADRYLAQHDIHDRVVKFRETVGETDALLDAMKHNVQIVDRYIKGLVKAFPADLEEAWTDALPEPYRLACRRELARRLGFLGALVRDADDCAHATLADVLREMADVVSTTGAALADGKVDASERKQVLREIDDAVAALTSMRHQVVAGQKAATVQPIGRKPRNA